MSVLTAIAGVPLFSTIQEAIAWARGNGLIGFHTHGWQGLTGYMGGASHSAAIQAIAPAPTTTTPTTTTMTSGNGSRY